MARQWRIEFPGAYYHVLSRGNGGQDIYCSNADRTLFLKLMGELSERFDIEIYAYVLMANHYHLLLRTREPNLSRSMHWLGTAYTCNFNLRNNRYGHLFQGRFKSIVVENDAYLLQLSYYIHCNPLRAGLVERLIDYPWSSYRYYAYKKKPPPWLPTQLILDRFGPANRRKTYRQKVQKYSREKKQVWEDVKHGLIYGSHDFVEDIKYHFLTADKDRELPQRNSVLRDYAPETLLERAAAYLEYDLGQQPLSKRAPLEEKNKRDFLIFILWELGNLSYECIGGYFGITYSAISHRVKELRDKFSQDKQLLKQYRLLKSNIKV